MTSLHHDPYPPPGADVPGAPPPLVRDRHGARTTPTARTERTWTTAATLAVAVAAAAVTAAVAVLRRRRRHGTTPR